MARDFSRSDRVGRQIQKELAEILHQGVLKDPRLGVITVQEVRVTNNLAFATIYFTLFDNSDRSEQEQLLNELSGLIRREISRRVKLRVTPELKFQYDQSIENGARLADLIEKADKGSD